MNNPTELRQLIAEAARAAGINLGPQEVARLAYHLTSRRAAPGLTPRLLDTLQGLAAGETREETAARLHLSEDTVRTHRRRLYDRLGARTAAHAVAIASRRGLLLPIGGPRPEAPGVRAAAGKGGRS